MKTQYYMFNKRKISNGFAIPVVLIMLVLLGLLIGALTFFSRQEFTNFKIEYEKIKAQYIAESGVIAACALLCQNKTNAKGLSASDPKKAATDLYEARFIKSTNDGFPSVSNDRGQLRARKPEEQTWIGHMTGKIGGGTYFVVVEARPGPQKFKSKSVKNLSSLSGDEQFRVLQEWSLNRYDIFSEGRFRRRSMIVYQQLVIHPEPRILNCSTEKISPNKFQAKITLR